VYYFLGTMHDDFTVSDLPKGVRNDLVNSNVVYFEMPEQSHTEFTDQLVAEYLENYPQLSKQLTPDAYAGYLASINHKETRKIIDFIFQQGKLAEQIHPCFVTSIIIPNFLSSNSNSNFANVFPKFYEKWSEAKNYEKRYILENNDTLTNRSVFDEKIEKYTKENNVYISKLDEIKQLVPIINKLNTPSCISSMEFIFGPESLYVNRRKFEAYQQSKEELKTIYISGDSVQLEKFISRHDQVENPELNSELIFVRNKIWFDTLNNNDSSQIFVVGGVAHFLGEGNVLSYFAYKGAKIERIIFED
jgi:uncharacterized protein YbaP (TraB family)